MNSLLFVSIIGFPKVYFLPIPPSIHMHFLNLKKKYNVEIIKDKMKRWQRKKTQESVSLLQKYQLPLKYFKLLEEIIWIQ